METLAICMQKNKTSKTAKIGEHAKTVKLGQIPTRDTK